MGLKGRILQILRRGEPMRARAIADELEADRQEPRTTVM
jgi:hypothetical protein